MNYTHTRSLCLIVTRSLSLSGMQQAAAASLALGSCHQQAGGGQASHCLKGFQFRGRHAHRCLWCRTMAPLRFFLETRRKIFPMELLTQPVSFFKTCFAWRWASLSAQAGKKKTCLKMQEPRFNSWVGRSPGGHKQAQYHWRIGAEEVFAGVSKLTL